MFALQPKVDAQPAPPEPEAARLAITASKASKLKGRAAIAEATLYTAQTEHAALNALAASALQQLQGGGDRGSIGDLVGGGEGIMAEPGGSMAAAAHVAAVANAGAARCSSDGITDQAAVDDTTTDSAHDWVSSGRSPAARRHGSDWFRSVHAWSVVYVHSRVTVGAPEWNTLNPPPSLLELVWRMLALT